MPESQCGAFKYFWMCSTGEGFEYAEQAHSPTAKHSVEEGEDSLQLDVPCRLLLSTGFTIS